MVNSDSQDEHRRFIRIPFDSRVQISNSDKTWSTELLDISLKGALVSQPKNWVSDIGGCYDLDIQLGTDQHLNMQVAVSHEEGKRIGFRCEHIDIDSITHLRRIVELNTGDEELLHRELNTLGVSET